MLIYLMHIYIASYVTAIILWFINDAIKILQLSHQTFWNLIGTANSKAAEDNSLNPGKLSGFLF